MTSTTTSPRQPPGAHRAAGRARVALAALVAALVVGLLALLTAPAPPAAASLRPQQRVAASAHAAAPFVGPHDTVLRGEGRARAPNYDQHATGSSVAADGGVNIEDANFAQTTYSESFSGSPGLFVGKTIDQVSAELRSGALTPNDVPINVVVRNGDTLILNTRSAQALIRAGIPRTEWNVVNQTGNPLFENLLNGQLSRNGLTNAGYPNPTSTGGG